MRKKGNPSLSSERRKPNKASANNNNKKDIQSKPKLTANKSAEKRRNVGLNQTTEPGYTAGIESKSKDKFHLTKPRKDKTGGQNSTNSRSAKSAKSKEYENTLNKMNEDNNDYEREKEKEKEKEFDFFSFKIPTEDSRKKEKDKNKEKITKNDDSLISKNKKNAQYKEDKKEADDLKKNKIYKDNDDDSDEGEKDKRDDFIHRALYKPKNDYKNRENNEKEKFNYNGKKREKE